MAKSTSAVHDIEAMCSDIDAISSTPDDDKYGWDLHVQFPVPEYSGRPEDRPPRKHAFVQIKSTVGNKTSHSIKYSNVQEAVTSTAPWFYLIVMPDKSVRCIHIWGDILADWLKAVRKAGVDGGALHKKKLNLNFPATTKITGNAAQWMYDQVNKVGSDYEEEKKKITESLGYEDGHGTGQFVFPDMDKKKMALMFLGLAPNVPISKFTLTKRRFDIADSQPQIFEQAGKITINPNALGTCNLKLKGVKGEPSLSLVGTMYAFTPPQARRENSFFRISAPPLELVRNPGGPYDMSLHMEPEKRYPLAIWVNYTKVTRWGNAGTIDLTMTSPAGLIMQGIVNLNQREDRHLDIMCAAIDRMNEIVAVTNITPPAFSETDLGKSFRDVLNFATAMQPNMQMQFIYDDPDAAIPSFKSVIYRACIRFEHLHFSCIVKRNIVSEMEIAGGRSMIADQPCIEEADTIAVTEGFSSTYLEGEYERYKQQFADDDSVFDLGEIDTLTNQID